MIVKREEIIDDLYCLDIFEKENHHDHTIIIDENGTYRWLKNEDVTNIMQNISLNLLCPLLVSMGYNKNSEVYRKLYRDLGYSLHGYWEVFYWEANNPDFDKYNPT